MTICTLFAGKRPRDLLNPKAVKYMQSIFSIKDAISKKESREISALYGVTATQVLFSFAFYFLFEDVNYSYLYCILNFK